MLAVLKVFWLRFCQIVSRKNRIERVIYARLCLAANYNFYTTVFIDESHICATKHANKKWHKPFVNETHGGLEGRFAHVPSVSVFGGISRRGRTRLVIYDGRLNSLGFQYIFSRSIIPFINYNYANHHTLHMDNAPCHSSRSSTDFMRANNINHFRTPAQSPDLNPIELVWHDLKDFISKEVKPRTLARLKEGIIQFWVTRVTVAYCNSKIDHINRVVKAVIKLNGKATGL
jgi:transposase